MRNGKNEFCTREQMRAMYLVCWLYLLYTELFQVGGVFIKTDPCVIHDISPGREDYANFETFFVQNSSEGFSSVMQITPILKSCKTGNSLNLELVLGEFVGLPRSKNAALSFRDSSENYEM